MKGQNDGEPARESGSKGAVQTVAEKVGMEREIVQRLLDGDADRDMLSEEDKTAREMGVTGVPCFIVGGRYVLQGAQPPEVWTKVIRELVESAQSRAEQPEATP